MNTKSHNTMRRSPETNYLRGDRRAMLLTCQ
ncbi:hypothetical protein HDF12_000611 [Edaphobacter lichenicola]|uniref:Uncharacterized protein n=2 Tax=Tunturiibacter TaxID=3154218 RepID=A0A7Y9T1P3_9BACT|nr:hypothetical protein [Edaphobacter lichenicola]NYF50246.1 hypothetical protein [Edaphobacter lichenicola]